jgi:hypothetical protein
MSSYEQLLHPTVRGGVQIRTGALHVVHWLLAPFVLISKIWSCWHRRMSRPFTRDGETYRVCLRCGVHRRFDLEQWKTKGSYYRDKEVTQPVSTLGSEVPERAKLRLA